MKTFSIQIRCPLGCQMKLGSLPSLVRHLQARHPGWLEGIEDCGELGASTIEVLVIVRPGGCPRHSAAVAADVEQPNDSDLIR